MKDENHISLKPSPASRGDPVELLGRALGTFDGSLRQYLVLFLLSRFAAIALLILLDLVVADHFPGSDVFQYYASDNDGIGVHWLQCILKPFTRWDASRFLGISRNGYINEQDVAFYPLLPVLVKFGGQLVRTLAPSIDTQDSLVISGILISNISSMVSLCMLVRICRKHFKIDKALEPYIVFCFCFSPSSVFNVAVYSEPLFMALTWTSLFYLFSKGVDNKLKSLLFFFFASCVRSNGVLNFIFFFCVLTKELLDSPLNSLSSTNILRYLFSRRFIKYSVFILLGLLTISYPSLVWDHRSRYIYGPCACYYQEDELKTIYSNTNGVVDVNDMHYTYFKLCIDASPTSFLAEHHQKSLIQVYNIFLRDTAYSVIQRKYWNVGAFNYYKLKQIPNFILATPIFIIAWLSFFSNKPCATVAKSQNRKTSSSLYLSGHAIFGLLINEYKAHTLITCCVLLVFAHIQISTRLLLSSSPIYIITMADTLQSSPSYNTKIFVLSFLFLYNIIGIFMFANHLPWT